MQRLRSTDTDTAEKTKILIGAPKSDTSMRTIPLTDNAAELCRKFAVRNPSAYILTGTPEFMEPRSFQYHIEKYTRECGLCGVHAHTLRHTFATRAVEVGFEIKTLSEILGHANTTITLNRYVHTSLELKRTNMDKLYPLSRHLFRQSKQVQRCIAAGNDRPSVISRKSVGDIIRGRSNGFAEQLAMLRFVINAAHNTGQRTVVFKARDRLANSFRIGEIGKVREYKNAPGLGGFYSVPDRICAA